MQYVNITRPSRNLWPWAIILTFVVFISGTVSLVVMACSQRVELVRPNYYEQELRYQAQVERLNRTQQLAIPARVTYDAARKALLVSLPPEHRQAQLSGSIELYRPSEAGLDRRLELHPDAQGTQTIDAAALAHGLWKVRLAWRVAGQEYFMDQKVVIGRSS